MKLILLDLFDSLTKAGVCGICWTWVGQLKYVRARVGMVLSYPNIHILNNYIIPLSCSALSTIWNSIVLILHTCTHLSLKNLSTIPIPSMRFMLGSGTELVGRFRLFSSVRYCVLPGAVWCGAVHTFSHTLLQKIKAPVKVNPFLCFFSFWLVRTLCTNQSISGRVSSRLYEY